MKEELKKSVYSASKKGYKTIYIDIMVDGRFYKQIPYQYNPLWEIDAMDVENEVLKRYSHLKGKKYELGFSNQRIGRK